MPSIEFTLNIIFLLKYILFNFMNHILYFNNVTILLFLYSKYEYIITI
jgi:hypothetical protein